MKIGLISDTHSFLDKHVFKHFEACDEIWHAGDVGDPSIATSLADFKPLKGVFGNIDGSGVRQIFPEDLVLERGGKTILITHIAGKPPRYNARVRDLIARHKPHLLVCGHSHILKVEMDKTNNLLFMNPGAAGRHGFHKIRTLIRFDIAEGTFKNLEVIELGGRSS